MLSSKYPVIRCRKAYTGAVRTIQIPAQCMSLRNSSVRMSHSAAAGSFWAGRGKSRDGPFGGGRMFDQGHLKFVILRLLDEKPRHGYEVTDEGRAHLAENQPLIHDIFEAV
jgi:hypothetical protein